MNSLKLILAILFFFSIHTTKVVAQKVLIGVNYPHKVVNDGDFSLIHAGWRLGKQSPMWKITVISGNNANGDASNGIADGRLFSSNNEAIAESVLLNTNPEYQKPKVGDVFNWEFGGDVEYTCDKATITLSLMFGDHETIITKPIHVKGSDGITENFKGSYTLTAEDVAIGKLPKLRARLKSANNIKIYLCYVNLSVYDAEKSAPLLSAKKVNNNIILSWTDDKAKSGDKFRVYRKAYTSNKYELLKECTIKRVSDANIISGMKYDYLVTRIYGKGLESGPSNIVTQYILDKKVPDAPTFIEKISYDSEIELKWSKNEEKDFYYYSLYRGDEKGENLKEIATHLKRPTFEDILAPKGVDNTYFVYAYDYSGNRSNASEPIKARVKTVYGASFSDLIKPIPLRGKLMRNTWGAPNVLPRDINNGIESPDWTYWGCHPVYDPADKLYHILVARWPEGSIRGHWEWPFSTVAYATSKDPIGPYKIKRDLAYDYQNGKGHNPDIILMNDGTYALYSLINWEPTIFTSNRMKGPWKLLGKIKYDESSYRLPEGKRYIYERNLSGVQTKDGSILIVTKNGAMMQSQNGLLGPYKILTDDIMKNPTLPKRYSKWGYEDPVMWKDEVQYHMIINAFIAKRAMYFRSGDGINWVYDPGLAYTNEFTVYEDGTPNIWDKLERPHIITDKYGRAEYLSLAVIDVPKEKDYGHDNHSAKNTIIPLIVSRRIEMLNKKRVDSSTDKIRILVRSEKGFHATRDMDIKSLRFGAPSKVNYGYGSKVVNSKPCKDGIILEFNGIDTGVTTKDFVCKMLGRTNSGGLLFGYSKCIAD